MNTDTCNGSRCRHYRLAVGQNLPGRASFDVTRLIAASPWAHAAAFSAQFCLCCCLHGAAVLVFSAGTAGAAGISCGTVEVCEGVLGLFCTDEVADVFPPEFVFIFNSG